MKGFPNQIADFTKLAKGIKVALDLVDAGENAKQNSTFGEALVHAQVAGTGHNPMPVADYLAAQVGKPAGNQGHQTAARGLRELYRSLGLIDDSGDSLIVTPLGRQAANFADQDFDEDQKTFWRTALSNMSNDGDGDVSHPYQVLLRLVASRPGISRAKCALALEAKNNSNEELDRIAKLSDLEEGKIRAEIGVSLSNWNNAKKMLPRFAEQLGDVIKTGQSYTLAQTPGQVASTRGTSVAATAEDHDNKPRTARKPRKVTSNTIGQAGTSEQAEPPPPPDLDPAKMAAAIAIRADRVKRHNLIVKALAAQLADAGFDLFEDPFDIFAPQGDQAILVEVKTLDGSVADERDRVRDALSQILYYEAFVTEPLAGERKIVKVACFEQRPTDDHIGFLGKQGIETVWKDADKFVGVAGKPGWL
ncbi:MAG: hypothetical protein JNN10_07655 [Sphingopyxis sp.]|uniref:hypothetical protein n=1 Tax=Sphingopyxis sp. TaxID=1908224 RepID=UPI001A38DAD5|nr:hypothetical protein [Sphingopyxis sp.]MBL9066152.1 hypothetical protein [Sphingopyxis sp.]